jgi:antitoxin CptB
MAEAQDRGPTLARLRWRCRRGMRELDAVLQTFLLPRGAQLSAEELAAFSELLELPDPDLHAYLVGRNVSQDPTQGRLIAEMTGLPLPGS